jgi:hypothetical protein
MKQKSKPLRFFSGRRGLHNILIMAFFFITGCVQVSDAQVVPTVVGIAGGPTVMLPIYAIDKASLLKLISSARGNKAKVVFCLTLTTTSSDPNAGSCLTAYIVKKHLIHFGVRPFIKSVFIIPQSTDAGKINSTVPFYPYVISDIEFDAKGLKGFLEDDGGASKIYFCPSLEKDSTNSWDTNYHLVYNLQTNSQLYGSTPAPLPNPCPPAKPQ